MCSPPPGRLIAMAMDLTVMAATQRDCELIADLSAEGGLLSEAQVVRASDGCRPQTRQGCWATYRTWSRSRRRRGSGMARTLLSTTAVTRLARNLGNVACLVALGWLARMWAKAVQLVRLLTSRAPCTVNRREPCDVRLERLLDQLWHQLRSAGSCLKWNDTPPQGCEVHHAEAECAKFGEQSIPQLS